LLFPFLSTTVISTLLPSSCLWLFFCWLQLICWHNKSLSEIPTHSSILLFFHFPPLINY
jgi:hypothetical protein